MQYTYTYSMLLDKAAERTAPDIETVPTACALHTHTHTHENMLSSLLEKL